MKILKDLLSENLVWTFEPNSTRFYFTDLYDKEICILRMNDFPDEPMWTLFFNGESMNFDDKPSNWKIHYRQN